MSIGNVERSGREGTVSQTLTAQAREDEKGWLDPWYRWTTPPLPPPGASLQRRELVRRARLASIILLMASIVLIVALFSFITSLPNVLSFLSALSICAVGLAINRIGGTWVTGMLLVLGSDFGFVLSILGAPHGLNTYNLPLLDLLVIGELIAVSILPGLSVFVVALVHCLFIAGVVTFAPHSADVGQMLATYGAGVMIRPIFLQIFVAVISFLWVRSMLRALARADRAEEIVALQEAIAQQKQQLEEGVEEILQMHVRIANGNFNQPITLPRENLLWKIAVSLNTMMGRLQRLSRTEYELVRVQNTIARLIAVVRQAKIRRSAIQVERSGTSLDPLLQELAGKRLE